MPYYTRLIGGGAQVGRFGPIGRVHLMHGCSVKVDREE